MTTIPLHLPSDLLEFIEAKVKSGEFATANDYIVALLDAAKNKRSGIEAALLEGLSDGPAEEWTRQEWNEIKERVIRRHQES